MNIYVAKDNYSFYIISLFNEEDQLTFDWSLSKSYSMVLGKGSLSINSKPKAAIGIFNIEPNVQIVMNAQTEAITMCSFLLDDDTIMNDLFPAGSTLTQLRNSSSNLIEIGESLDFEKITPVLSFDGEGSITTFSISDLNTKVIEALSP